MYLASYTNSHHDATDLVNQWMVKNAKTCISRERNMTLPQMTHFEKLPFFTRGSL